MRAISERIFEAPDTLGQALMAKAGYCGRGDITEVDSRPEQAEDLVAAESFAGQGGCFFALGDDLLLEIEIKKIIKTNSRRFRFFLIIQINLVVGGCYPDLGLGHGLGFSSGGKCLGEYREACFADNGGYRDIPIAFFIDAKLTHFFLFVLIPLVSFFCSIFVPSLQQNKSKKSIDEHASRGFNKQKKPENHLYTMIFRLLLHGARGGTRTPIPFGARS